MCMSYVEALTWYFLRCTKLVVANTDSSELTNELRQGLLAAPLVYRPLCALHMLKPMQTISQV